MIGSRNLNSKDFTLREYISAHPDYTFECSLDACLKLVLTPDINKRIANGENVQSIDVYDESTICSDNKAYQLCSNDFVDQKVIHFATLQSCYISHNFFYGCNVSEKLDKTLKREINKEAMIAAIRILSRDEYEDVRKKVYVLIGRD